MRKLKKKVCLIAFCILGMMLVTPIHVHAKTKNPSIVNLKSGKVYKKYDITGDQKKDRILIKKYKDKADYYTGFTISINGKKIKKDKSNSWGSITLSTKLVTLKNGKVYLWVQGIADGGNEVWGVLYRYKSGKLIKALRFANYSEKYGRHVITDKLKVSGNRLITVEESVCVPLGVATYKYNYIYKDGKLKIESRAAKVTSVAMTDLITDKVYLHGYGTMRKAKTLYTSPSTKKTTGTVLRAKTEAKPLEIYMSKKILSVKIRTRDGKTGWVKCGKKEKDSNLLFRECFYAG